MTIKLDKRNECTIDRLYASPTSIFKENDSRVRKFKEKEKEAQTILNEAPEEIKEPEKTDSFTQNLINDAKYQLKLKENELATIKDLLLKLDVSIDETDEVIQNIDKCANVLIDEINEQITVIKSIYDKRISEGCRNSLRWEYVRDAVLRFGANDSPNNVVVYELVEDVGKIENHYYGLKYYRKPLNNDYGFTAIKDFTGYIKKQSNELAIIGSGGTSKIQIGDKITNDLDGNDTSTFTTNVSPSVIGFGTTSVIGIHTSISGIISLGSTILAVTGIGTEENPDLDDYDIKLNDYVVNSTGIATDSKVIGIGTTSISVSYINESGNLINVDAIFPSVILDKQAFEAVDNEIIQFGTYSTYPSLILNDTATATVDRDIFDVVRQTEDLSLEFDPTKSPFSPVTIGIIKNKNQFGYGHTVKLINNGHPSKPREWNIFMNEDEPKVGNEPAVYYEGNKLWPKYGGEIDYAYLYGRSYFYFSSSAGSGPGYTTNPPGNGPPNPDDRQVCQKCNADILVEVPKLEAIKDNNLKRIQKLVSAASVLRTNRDSQELRAWGFLQSIAYLQSEIKTLKDYVETLKDRKDIVDAFSPKPKKDPNEEGEDGGEVPTTNDQNQELSCPDVENL
jgi:transcription termination factor NusB